ncbi:MAG: hypothetical protein M1835_000366 [Candelina submexicana]|nr:MAG: hypothetical protein M1835_000366 [Candelina submexicana]
MATVKSFFLGIVISCLVCISSAYSLNPRTEVIRSLAKRNPLAKRDLGPFCHPPLGELTYDDCMATWDHLPTIRGEVRFSAESPGVFGAARVQLPYFERPRNLPTTPSNRCGIIVFNWPRLTGVTTVADWQWLRLAARSIINECPQKAHVGGMMIGLGAGRTYYGDRKDHPSGNLNIAVLELPSNLPDDPNRERDWASFLAGCAREMAINPQSPTSVTQCNGFNALLGGGGGGGGAGPGPSGGSQSGMTAWSTGAMQEKPPGTCGKQAYCVNSEGCSGGFGCTCNLLRQKVANLVFGAAEDLMGTCIALVGAS